MNIRRNDNVKVTAGKDKGKTGKVIQVFPSLDRVVVEGVNVMQKHLRQKQKSDKGQKLEFSAPLRASNVMLICPKCTKPMRVARKIMKDPSGRKTKARMCRKCKEVIE